MIVQIVFAQAATGGESASSRGAAARGHLRAKCSPHATWIWALSPG